MKHKLITSMLVYLMVILLAGCNGVDVDFNDIKTKGSEFITNSRTEILSEITYSEDALCEEFIAEIFSAIDNSDREVIKSLFSSEVIKNNLDIDNQIEFFFESYNGPYDTIDDVGADSSSASYGREGEESHIINDFFVININGNTYHGLMTLSTIGGSSREDASLLVFELATAEAYESEYYCGHYQHLGENGIFFQSSPELRDGLVIINGRTFMDLAIDRNLTEDEVYKAVSTSSNYDEFVREIGMPDAIWDPYDYRYYKLDSGLFVALHINPYESLIEYIYIVDEDMKIKTLWIHEDFVEISGDYFEYTYVDRALTSDEFLENTDHRQSVNNLEYEFGVPSAKEAFHVYYELEDGRYMMCKVQGTDIRVIYLVDNKSTIELLRNYKEGVYTEEESGKKNLFVQERVTIDGTTYRNGFYDDLWPFNIYFEEAYIKVGDNEFRHVDSEKYDLLYSGNGFTSAGIFYCEESQWEEAYDYYNDGENYRYYCHIGGNYSKLAPTIIDNIDTEKFDELMSFADQKAYEPFGVKEDVETIRLPEPDNEESPKLVFYKVSKDGYFESDKGNVFHVVNGKLLLVFYYDGNHGEYDELVAVEVPDDIGAYFVELVELIVE